MLPEGTVPTLLKPQNKATLTKVLPYHVVAGTMNSRALMLAITAGGGRATLMTVAGARLATLGSPDTVMLTDVKGDVATVAIANVCQSNGVIHIISHVLLPGRSKRKDRREEMPSSYSPRQCWLWRQTQS